jgi:DNA primase
VVLSFDPDAAGEGAAVRSCELLVAEGFSVNVAVLPAGADPDTFVRSRGADAYQDCLRQSSPYLDFLLDRTARRHRMQTDEGRRAFLGEMLAVAARIPDAAQRDQFADRLSHKAQITEDVVRSEIRRAAVARKTVVTARELPPLSGLKPAERGLIWSLVHEPDVALSALATLEPGDLDGLPGQRILELARNLNGHDADSVPSALLERLSEGDLRLVTGIAAESGRPAEPGECVRTLRLLRYDRERAALQQEIDRLQRSAAPDTADQIEQLGLRKIDLKRRIEALGGERW